MNPAEAVPPAETPPGAAKPVESPAEELMSAKPPAEIVIPAATSMAPPSVEARAETVKSASSENLGDFGREAFAALVQSQTAVARGLEALSAELAGLALSGIDAAARTATDMLTRSRSIPGSPAAASTHSLMVLLSFRNSALSWLPRRHSRS
jgi:hypothetical protein